MRLFLDTCVLLAASASDAGASREIFRLTPLNGWTLISSPYVLDEVVRNLPHLPLAAVTNWLRLRRHLIVRDDVLTLDRPALFGAAKDRPILFSALAWSDVLLTQDRGDFGEILGGEFYGLAVLTPGMLLAKLRAEGSLKLP